MAWGFVDGNKRVEAIVCVLQITDSTRYWLVSRFRHKMEAEGKGDKEDGKPFME
jgi:hypothetical protein